MMSRWVAVLLCIGVFTACGDDDRPIVVDGGPVGDAGDLGVRPDGGDGGRVDGGGDGGGDVCAGRTLCTTAGTSCDADTLVVCAADADGCLVETRTGCGATSQVCNAPAGADAACVDPCTLLAPEVVCTTDGERTCTGATLGVCAPDTNGCLVITQTDCAATAGGVCDTSGAMPVCAAPADPCAAIPAADRCTVAGTSCSTTSLVTCAPNAFGCLVATTTDCAARAGGACDATGTAAVCTATTPCAGITQCTTVGATCDGPTLVVCAPDAFGCNVATRTTCTDAPFGFCDATATPAPACSTAPVDPCLGVTACGTATTRSCTDRATLHTCAPNAFGCYVATDTTCTTGGEVCDATSGTAACVDPCSLVTTCATATSCASNELVTCTANADGCLVETSRAPCAYTCDSTGTAACVDPYCPQAQPTILDCASGTVTGTTLGGTTAISTNCDSSTNYAGAERVYRFRNTGTARVAVTIVSTRTSGTGDFDLFAWDSGGGTDVCATTAPTAVCLDSSAGTSATETVTFLREPGQMAYVAYDIYSSTTTTGDYTLAVTCTPVVCGDGILATGETCDDGNTTPGDGCSGVCAIETGFGCTGTPSVCTPLCGNGALNAGETCDDANTNPGDGCSATCTVESGYGCGGAPSVCVTLAANSVCASATAITATTTITGERSMTGGARPTGTGCGYASGNNALYYSVTVPAYSRVIVQTTPSFDIVLAWKNACGDAGCTGYTDASPERTTLTNNTASAVTRIVAAFGYGSTSSGTWDIAFTYEAFVCGNGIIEGAELCDAGPTPAGPGCSATCTVVAGYSCSGSPSVCATSATNGTCAAATVITATTALTGEATIGGGAKPTGTACGGGTGNNTLYYAVTVPPMTNVNVATTPATGSDIVLSVESACGVAACSSTTDAAPERTTLTNSTATEFTRIVAIRNYGSTTQATYDVTFVYAPFVCGNGIVEGTEACDAGPTPAGPGCSATCTVDSGYACSGSPSVCRAVAANAVCSGGTAVSATTTITGENLANAGLPVTGTGCIGSGVPTTQRAMYYSLTIPAYTNVNIVATPTAFDAVLAVEDACGAAACGWYRDAGGSGGAETGSVTNSTASPITRIVTVFPYYTTSTTGTFNVAFTYVPFLCGNGILEGTEACDDGATVAGDGCSATCTIEAGFTCVGTPSVCSAAAANATCATATVVTSTTASTGENNAGGGPRPASTTCGYGTGVRALWYAVTIPAGQQVVVQTAPAVGSNIVLFKQNACGDTTCAAYTDSAPERLTLTNPGAASITQDIGVYSYGTGASTFDIAFSYGPMPYAAITASCIDISTAPENAYTVAGETDDATTAITALPVPFTFFGTTITHWSMSSNGFLQLWTSATGTPSSAWSNVAIPAAGTPNNFIAPLWDDLQIGSLLGGGTGSTRTMTTGSGSNRVQVFEWIASQQSYATGGLTNERFQVLLYETTNVIEIHYCSTGTGSTAATGNSATIGIENAAGTSGVQVSNNTGGAAVTGTGYRFTP
jgi:cysteine-rich repeat protein